MECFFCFVEKDCYSLQSDGFLFVFGKSGFGHILKQMIMCLKNIR